MFVEDLPFDESFELSLFRTKSETALDDTVLDLDFLIDLEVQKENRSIGDYILNSSQSSINATNISDLSKSAEKTSTTLNSIVFPSISKINSQLWFIPTLPLQLITPTSPSTAPLNPSSSNVVVNSPRVMVAEYALLVLPQNLNDMPTDYQIKIPLFDATQSITAQQHVDKMNEFFDLRDVEAENVTMRLFVQSFGGEVRKWFRALPATSIHTFLELHRQFLDRWEVKKNPLQILSE